MKTIYTIPTPYGIITRTSNREYTHVVVECYRPYVDKYQEAFAIGYASSKKLAEKAMKHQQKLNFLGNGVSETMMVIEITPEMKREVKPRAKKMSDREVYEATDGFNPDAHLKDEAE